MTATPADHLGPAPAPEPQPKTLGDLLRGVHGGANKAKSPDRGKVNASKLRDSKRSKRQQVKRSRQGNRQ